MGVPTPQCLKTQPSILGRDLCVCVCVCVRRVCVCVSVCVECVGVCVCVLC